jgi:hypothetical protein
MYYGKPEQVDAIRTREDLGIFLREFSAAYKANPEAWQNSNLGQFLDALASWTEDLEGFYVNRGQRAPDTPDWRVFAQMLMGATMYE